MGLGVGIFLAAVGAVLAFAVSATVSGVNIHTVGWILLIVGILGVIISMFTAISVSRTFLFAIAPKKDNAFKKFLFSNGLHIK